MAARRVGQKAIDWIAFAERVPPNQRIQFNTLKTRFDALKSRHSATPEKPAPLDWDMYRKIVPIPGLVDKFEKQFAAVKVPLPNDPVTATIDAQQKEMDKNAAVWKADGEKKIAEYQKEVDKFTNMVPWEEMTVEEFDEYFPERSLATRKKKYEYYPYQPLES